MLERPDPGRRRSRRAWALLGLTALSVFFTRLVWWSDGLSRDSVVDALLFATALLFILASHEAGHLLAARRHRFGLSVPWFLPFPFWIGTLGAVIALEERPRTRTGLAALGVSGPLAGLLATLLVAGCWQASAPAHGAGWALSRPLLLLPFAAGHVLTTADPLGFAAWLGCLVTALNLVPLGQLDGGHVLAAVDSRLATRLRWPVTVLLLLLGLLWWGWAVWAGLVHLLGRPASVRVRDEGRTPLGAAGWGWVFLGVVCWLLSFSVTPLGP